VPELVFHLADALFRALLPTSRYLEFLLRNDAPFHLEDRLKVMELLRLRDYLAACFGFICCGDVEVAVEQSFLSATGVAAGHGDRAAQDGSLPSGAVNVGGPNGGRAGFGPSIVQSSRWCWIGSASAILRTALEQWWHFPEQFEAEVLEMDPRRIRRWQLPDDHKTFSLSQRFWRAIRDGIGGHRNAAARATDAGVPGH
jgi:hypothetical protein